MIGSMQRKFEGSLSRVREWSTIIFRGQSFGGCCQWVLDVVRETVEWPYQPLGFDSLALRQVLDLRI
jgi:hypothetical protein